LFTFHNKKDSPTTLSVTTRKQHQYQITKLYDFTPLLPFNITGIKMTSLSNISKADMLASSLEEIHFYDFMD